MPATYEFEIREKGRAVLPAGLRSACGFGVGTRLIARPLGPGQAIVETAEAVLARIWADAPREDVDAVGELLRWRAEEAADRADSSPSLPSTDDVGGATLRALGLA
jgi:bifunctional DNA-binding transcriptional regulator/antitoxin component of YhaV-PrlF toxin-antitoxin module